MYHLISFCRVLLRSHCLLLEKILKLVNFLVRNPYYMKLEQVLAPDCEHV